MRSRLEIRALVSLCLAAFPGLCTFWEPLHSHEAEGFSLTQEDHFYPLKDIRHLGASPVEFHDPTKSAKRPRGALDQALVPQNGPVLAFGKQHEQMHPNDGVVRAESPAVVTYIHPELKDSVASEPNLYERLHYLLSGRTTGMTNHMIAPSFNVVPALFENTISQCALYPPPPSKILYNHREVLQYCYDWAAQHGYSVVTKNSRARGYIAVRCSRHSEGCPWEMFWRLSRKAKEMGFRNVEAKQGGPHNHSSGDIYNHGVPRSLKRPSKLPDPASANTPCKKIPMNTPENDWPNFIPSYQHQSISPQMQVPDSQFGNLGQSSQHPGLFQQPFNFKELPSFLHSDEGMNPGINLNTNLNDPNHISVPFVDIWASQAPDHLHNSNELNIDQ